MHPPDLKPAPLDLAALRGLLEKARAAEGVERRDASERLNLEVMSALPALLNFAAEAAGLLGDAEFGGDDTEEAGAWEFQRAALLARLAGNGEAR